MPVSTATEFTEGQRPPEDDYEPPRMKYLALALSALLAAVGLFALFGGGSGEPERPAGTQQLPFMDGTLTVVEQDRLVLRDFDNTSQTTFAVKPEDAGNFDIAHLQSHSSVGIPTRIYYRDEGGTKYAVYKEDAPVNSAQP
jgi:hypothetical protein